MKQQADGAPYHHLADGSFRNPPGSLARNYSGGEMFRFLWGRIGDRGPVQLPDGHVAEAGQVTAGLQAAGSPSVTWLGHAAFLIRIAGKTVLTDPFLGETAGPAGFGPRRFVPPAMTVDELPPIDVLVVSHNHYDHLDAWTVERLPGKDRMTVVVPLRLGDFFRRRGYTNVIELDWEQSYQVDGLAITALPAVHFSRRGLNDANRTLWASFAFTAADARIWFSGDTAYGEVFNSIGARYGPFDLALVGIGAYEPRSIMKASHATPEEAIQISRDVRAQRALGMHWGTIKLTTEDPFEAAWRFRRAAVNAGFAAEDAWILRIGESRSVPAAVPAAVPETAPSG